MEKAAAVRRIDPMLAALEIASSANNFRIGLCCCMVFIIVDGVGSLDNNVFSQAYPLVCIKSGMTPQAIAPRAMGNPAISDSASSLATNILNGGTGDDSDLHFSMSRRRCTGESKNVAGLDNMDISRTGGGVSVSV